MSREGAAGGGAPPIVPGARHPRALTSEQPARGAWPGPLSRKGVVPMAQQKTAQQNHQQWTKQKLLAQTIEHIDVTSFDARPIVDAYERMSFQSRNLAKAARIYNMMLADT